MTEKVKGIVNRYAQQGKPERQGDAVNSPKYQRYRGDPCQESQS